MKLPDNVSTCAQKISQAAALLAEKANATTYGNTPRADAIDRQLADLGVKERAAEQRKEATESEAEPKRSSPVGRSQRPRQQG